MSTDRELLELAAKAAGLIASLQWWEERFIWKTANVYAIREWNPLTDDGDALRLAVKLRLLVDNNHETGCLVLWHLNTLVEPLGSDPYAATRRAIVRAAAEIGGQA